MSNYLEPKICHNCSKHWVDDVNNCCNNPIDLDNICATKCWPTWPFTFLVQFIMQSTYVLEPRGKFRSTTFFVGNLQLMKNQYGINLWYASSPVVTRDERKVVAHKMKSPIQTATWENAKSTKLIYLCTTLHTVWSSLCVLFSLAWSWAWPIQFVTDTISKFKSFIILSIFSIPKVLEGLLKIFFFVILFCPFCNSKIGIIWYQIKSSTSAWWMK